MTISNLDKDRKRKGQRGRATEKAGSKRATVQESAKAESRKSKDADGAEEAKPKRGRPRSKKKSGAEETSVDPANHKGARKALRHAVKAAVKQDSGKIAKSLVNTAAQGNLRSAEMMLELMNK
jgi:hypothetical protein